jgi:dTDP-4-dehydrorhamnose reductase
MRVAVTGAGGRLGRALIAALADSPYSGPGGPIGWTRAEFDLDAPAAPGERLDRDRIEAVVHAAAWTDVDGCAREPELALRRNGEAVGVLARACAKRGLHLVVVSTNEVFDGTRTDRRGYRIDDPVAPPNPYGVSKLAGERAALAAYESGTGELDIVRTAWLFGPGAPDFPAKILAAAERAQAAGEPLRLVADEWASPTYVADLAEAIVELVTDRPDGPAAIHHVVNAGVASRADWAREVLRVSGMDGLPTEDVPSSTWPRPSTPPRWGVLEPTPLPSGEHLRPWQEAMADYAPLLRRAAARAAG